MATALTRHFRSLLRIRTSAWDSLRPGARHANPRKTSRRQKRAPLKDFCLSSPTVNLLCVDGILRVFIVFIYLLAAEFTLPAVRLHSLALNVVIEKMLLTFVCLFVSFFIAIVGLGGNRTEGSGKSCDWIIGLLCLFTK